MRTELVLEQNNGVIVLVHHYRYFMGEVRLIQNIINDRWNFTGRKWQVFFYFLNFVLWPNLIRSLYMYTYVLYALYLIFNVLYIENSSFKI